MAIDSKPREREAYVNETFCFGALEPQNDDDDDDDMEDVQLLAAIDDRDEANDGSRRVELISCLKWSPISATDLTRKEILGSASNETDEEQQMDASVQVLDDACGFSFDCEYAELGGSEVNHGRDTCSWPYATVKKVSSPAKSGHSDKNAVGNFKPCSNTTAKRVNQVYSHHDEGLPNNFNMDQMDFEPNNPCDYTPENGELIMACHSSNAGTPRHMTTPGSGSGTRVVQTPHGPAVLLTTSMTPLFTPVPSSLAHHGGNGQPRKFQRWCDNEDVILRYAVSCEDESKPNWRKISKNFFSCSRSPLQCKSRWTKSLQPGIVLGKWQEHEDATIRQLRQEGVRWADIADQLPGRIAEHIRDRYVNFLDPDLKKTPWSKSEDQILFEQQKLHGNKWTTIAKSLPGRSENAVKNRWHNAKMTQRRRLRRHAAERTLQSMSLRARQHLAEPRSDDESLYDADQTADV